MLKMGKTAREWLTAKQRKMENDETIPTRKLLKYGSGPILTICAMLLTQLIYSETNMRIDITVVLALLIIYTFSIGGLWMGGISVGLSLLYCFLFSIEGTGALGKEAHLELMINHFGMYGIAGSVGLLHHIFGTKYKALQVMRGDLDRAEQHAVMMAIQSSLDGKITKVQPGFCKLVGYTEKELLTMNFKDITHTDDLQKEARLFKQVSKGQIKSIEIEKRYIAKNGEIKWVYLNASLITDKTDNPKGFLAYVKDITELKETEQALKESEERYRSVIDLSPIAIFIHDENKLDFVNQEGVRLLGADSSDEVLKRNILSFIEEEVGQGKMKEHIAFLNQRGGFLYLAERSLRRLDGSTVDVEVTITTIPYRDKHMFLVFVQDISAKKQAEALQKNVEENTKLLSEAIEYDIVKTEFFANISHELRTPLNVILGTQQLLQIMGEQCVDEEKRVKFHRYLHVMKQNGNRLLRLVNNLIDITKMDSGYFQIHLANHDIISVVENITLSVADYVEGKGMNLTFDTDVEEKIVACDPDSMERIMLNLLSNAVKFTRSGGEIQVHIYDKGDRIQIVVRDTGIGIPKDKQQMIFERFRQVDKSLTRNHEGSGIGLSLVKSLVEMQGGSISCESEEGKGSVFILEFPVWVLEEDINQTKGDRTRQSLIERVNVEFADIYSA
ncbi:MAG: domain S-box protein [Anaerosolibacter sp.]|uniref:sensor histidine kinase n=1 Tax=Anaerosolibacter sp. TaxID=1872527 RepID=UPI00261FEB4B|nr:PAS domain S-box protein [Anaerosolibacter sp.]MDF2547566.1 domain S-box protein [Anaerosolibacter sp.]